MVELRNTAGLRDEEAMYLTDLVRTRASNALPGERFLVMTRESIVALLPPGTSLADCAKGQCEVEVGRRIGADYIVSGEILRFGDELRLIVKVHACQSGAFLEGIAAKGGKVNDLESAMSDAIAPLFAKVLADAKVVANTASGGDTTRFIQKNRAQVYWSNARKAFDSADSTMSHESRRARERQGREELLRLIAEYPIGQQTLFETESAVMLLAEREAAGGEPCRARSRLREILSTSRDARWTTQAGRRMESLVCSGEQERKESLRAWFGPGMVQVSACFEAPDVAVPFTALQAQVVQFLSGVNVESVRSDCVDGKTDAGSNIVIRLKGSEQSNADAVVYSGAVKVRVAVGGRVVFLDEFPVRAPGADREIMQFRMAKAIAGRLSQRLEAIVVPSEGEGR